MYAKFSDVTYAAIHKGKKKFFVGSGTKVSFSKKHHLKSSMTYQKVNHDDYTFVVINTDGTMVEVEA
jgi:hypothetical protein